MLFERQKVNVRERLIAILIDCLSLEIDRKAPVVTLNKIKTLVNGQAEVNDYNRQR